MKRIAFVLCFIMVAVSFSACSPKTTDDAYELYTTITEAMSDVGSIEMTMDTTINAEIGEANTSKETENKENPETFSMTMSGNIKEVFVSETDLDMDMRMTLNILGQTMETKAYYNDGYYYYDIMGQKMKKPMDLETALKQTKTQNIKFDKEDVKSGTVENINGGKKLTFTLDGVALSDITDNMMESFSDIIPSEDQTDITFNDLDYTITVDENNIIKDSAMVLDMSYDVDGKAVFMNITVNMEVVSYGDVTIEFPDDLDTYVEMDKNA